MSVSVLVALDAKSYEILSRVITQSASWLNVMNLKTLHAPAPFATPAISLQNFTAELTVSFRGKPPLQTVRIYTQANLTAKL
jgi:hypothetical protein